MRLFKSAVLALCMTGAFALPALAQYDANGEPYSRQYYIKNPSQLNVALSHGAAPDQFVIAVSSADSFTGCPKLGDLPSTVKINPGTIEITVEGYVVDFRDVAPGSCDMSTKTPSASVTLNRKTLTDNDVKTIKFQAGMTMNYYDVILTGSRLMLMPSQVVVTKGLQRFKARKIPGVKNAMSLWFYPENTVVLSVPGAAKDDNVRDAVNDLAAQRKLKPIEEQIPDFVSPTSATATYYYVAASKAQLNGPAFTDGTPFGHIETDTTVFGLDGDEPAIKSLPVFARTPRAYE